MCRRGREDRKSAPRRTKSSGRSNLTTSSVIAKAKTPSVRASSRLFETNSLASAIILPVFQSSLRIRFLARNPEQSGAGEDGRTSHRTRPPPGPLSQEKVVSAIGVGGDVVASAALVA